MSTTSTQPPRHPATQRPDDVGTEFWSTVSEQGNFSGIDIRELGPREEGKGGKIGNRTRERDAKEETPSPRRKREEKVRE